MEWNGCSDAQLLQKFIAEKSEEAFAEVVRRYAPLVLGVCRRILGHGPDSEDAAQAVFVTLALKARTLHSKAPLAGWLHRVSRQISLDARKRALTRTRHERETTAMSKDTTKDWSALAAILDEELNALPETYRVPFLLHHVQGLTQAETAAMLDQKEGTISMRLNRAREMLKDRLAQSGVVLSVSLLTTLVSKYAASEEIPSGFAASTVKGASSVVSGSGSVATGLSTTVSTLVNSAVRDLSFVRLKVAAAACVVLAVAVCAAIGFAPGSPVVASSTAMVPSPTHGAPQPETKKEVATGDLEKLQHTRERATRFLQLHQNKDGSFGDTYFNAMSGLSVMALLANGKASDEADSAVRRGIEYVLSHGGKGGYLGESDDSKMYGHAICTMMLSQAALMTKDEAFRQRILQTLRAAVNCTIAAQHNGGWRYLPTSTDADISVSGWQIVSLRGAAEAGVAIPEKVTAEALQYVESLADPEGGFGYTTPKDHASLRGLGVLVLAAHGTRTGEGYTKTIEKILADGVTWNGPYFFYRNYYSAAGVYQADEAHWKKFYPVLYETLISRQKENGSFAEPSNNGESTIANGVYVTSLALLTLSLNDTPLPVFRRSP